MQEFQGLQQDQQEDQEVISFSFLEIKLPNSILSQSQAIIITQYGPASIFIDQHLQKSQEIGQVIQTTSNPLKLATIKQIDQLLVISFQKDIRYYYYQEYNLLKELEKNGLKQQPIYILMNVPSSALERYSDENSQLRQLNHNIESSVKQLEDPEELEGYFGDLFYSLKNLKSIAYILVQTNYDTTLELIQKYDEIRKHLPQIPNSVNKEFIKEQLKKYAKSLNRDNVHI
ncbi:unnamed protein product (macronuclear) [Paramecium tetraurelia]|uniref:Proteasome assembly chaperone 1 n=1 Tax=Paramecium tetraurelia TaxID=5888 RepID=A0D5X7_PARTE|nr:uncharacterized protein GSPATT00013874001 [Paramecium tetraurelia]CAK78444.1 unnamed protein product [Paramecium tetraurelia]|eukprot:XP_001445841.1 hypothetical protein (macronuclear) [Paramecium tetraurelia strain d4-2]